MEDLYKDDPNSWLWRAHFSKTVYNRPDPSQLPAIPISELKLWHSDLNAKWANNTSMTSQSTTMPTLKLNQNSSLTSEVREGSDLKKSKPGQASKRKAISDMFKEVKKTVRQFAGPPSRERTGAETVKSASGPKKEGHRLKKYFDHEVRPVSAMEKSSEVH